MSIQPDQQPPNLTPTAEAIRRQLEGDRQQLLTQQPQIETAREEWAREMERLDAEYQAMLDADPELRERLHDRDAVRDALLDAVIEDRGER